MICNFAFASFYNILTKIRVFVLFVENYINYLLDNNNRQTILQYNSNNKNITIDNIKIVVDTSKQKHILIELKIISFSNIVNVSINYTNILINYVL